MQQPARNNGYRNGHTNGQANGRSPILDYASSDRLPPHNRDAERSVLGSILRDNPVLDRLAPILRPEEFYIFGHQAIYRGALELRATGKPVDFVMLGNWLAKNSLLEDAGGHGYVVDLWDAAPGSSGNAVAHAKIVRAKAIARCMLEACGELSQLAYDPGVETSELLETAGRKFFNLSQLGSAGELIWQSEAMRLYLEDLDRRTGYADGEVRDQAIMTGLADLDRITRGMHQGELILVGARTSVGKSVFATNLFIRAAEQGHTVFVSTVEDSAMTQIFRQICYRSGLNSWKLRETSIPPEERDRIVEAASHLSALPICYDDRAGQTVTSIAAHARRLKAQNKLGMVVVDYLQLLDAGQGSRQREGRHEEVGRISRGLQCLARDLKVPVVALAQLNRETESRRDAKPRLSDLRESGSLEQDSHCVLLLHKPEPDDAERPMDILEVNVAKNKNGPKGEVTLVHEKATFRISNFAGLVG